MMRFSLITIVTLILVFCSCTENEKEPRSIIDFNSEWKFFLGDDAGAKAVNFDDTDWRVLNLPHDWSIEGDFHEDHPATTAGGALPSGIGWYRKTFKLPEEEAGKNIFIEFDGIYRNSEVWINGRYLGKRPNGYISFRYELTPYLKFGKEKNVIAVKVNNSAQPNSRWYTGSGIYRNVRLVTTGEVYVDHWGTFVKTPKVSEQSATVDLQVQLRSLERSDAHLPARRGSQTGLPNDPPLISVQTTIFDREGNEVAVLEYEGDLADSIHIINQEFEVPNPVLWSVSHPYLYEAVTLVKIEGKQTDCYKTTFGIRYFDFDSENGFFLNGRPMKILGVCLHHDLGALGAAINTRAIERQLEMLKEMGCNAVRTAHNPPAPELLDLCDQMGFIVMDETFDMWKKKKSKQDYHLEWDEWHKKDLEDHIRRDRNHPSVMMWSIGNEIREQFDSTGISITRELVEIVKNLDDTRPVTCALTENVPEKNFIYQSGALDLLGFNYKQEAYKNFPEIFPGEKIIATENMSALATRGHYDMPSDSIRRWPVDYKTPLEGNPDWTVSAYDNVSAYWGSTHEETWKIVKELDFMAGLFIWTGFDYLGEPTPYPWPARSSYFGIIDLAGFPKDAYYLYKSEWTDTPVLHVFPHWNPAEGRIGWGPGKTVDVWAYYNLADEVELFLNGRSLGVKKKKGDTMHVMWRVRYEPGTLKAISRKDGETVLEKEIRTAGKPAKIDLKADRSTIKADGKDLSFITVSILDQKGNLVPHADNLVHFDISGEGFIAGVDNGYQASHEPFKANHRKAFNGMCLAIVQANNKAGKITLKANSDGLIADEIVIETIESID